MNNSNKCIAYLLCTLLVTIASTQAALSQETIEGTHQETKVMESDPALPGVGWKWELEPTKLPTNWRTASYIRLVKSGSLTLFVTESGQVIAQNTISSASVGRGVIFPKFVVVLLDVDGKPIKYNWVGTSSNSVLSISSARYTIEDLSTIDSIGLAVLDLDGRRIAADAAAKEAEKFGARVLPLPIVGEQFDATLPTIECGEVDISDYKGKVVLIDCWATWCSPCMAKMDELKRLYAKFSDRGFVVIGINFDDNIDKAKKAIADKELSWIQVHAATAAKGYDDLWVQMSSISILPRLFLIDRDGVLRDDFFPIDLEASITAILDMK